MGVPALFRWLSKKYPKIILPVIEEEETKIPDVEGTEIIVPVDISRPNPNEEEFDNLYLDMNGIVHPCTHPEGKPAPENEEEMMVEIFSYTERVVNMIRPRKLLFMAIDGVAPRAKMNQQRSRRFRSAQEAHDKEEARKEAVALWEAMGKTLSEDEKSKKAWDSNAITPGTPFMDLLASSLRYWVARKMNTDPGWKQMEVIISDASVPGEGEHKIMDFIRRQRSNPGHDPNTRHVIYGLDADLIMLSLATHEPHFRVLREDVFFQEGSRTACRICGQEGHYAAQCTGTKADIQKKPPTEKKPFIFLDVAILREYLEAELQVSHTPFPFNLEQAIDDWVLLIFFVGNDFLPHLPSLEIREGAIDTLLKIWRDELPRMGGYLTNHGRVELARAQIILEGLAKREDDIFRRRREAEERQDQNAKRRKIEKEMSSGIVGPSPALNLTAAPTAPPGMSALSSLPARPLTNSFAAKADSIGLGGPKSIEAVQNAPTAAQALGGSNHDVVANRRAIRMANMSAAETLKAELAGLMPVKPSKTAPASTPKAVPVLPSASTIEVSQSTPVITDELELPGLGSAVTLPPMSATETKSNLISENNADHDMDADGDPDPDFADTSIASEVADVEPRGIKRSLDDVNDADETEDILAVDDDDAPPDVPVELALKVNPDGTVEQEDTVQLWEPGYQERYYRQKFGVEYSDAAFKKDLTTRYVEGLAWVLQYYYQGTPSWTWYYPYHFAPFAVDFQEVTKMDMTFNPGQPFKPFEQLMGVFPAASRMHIPEVFQSLMTDDDSPIIDFYPSTFQIDMNGKKMAWQGVALLPFIDEKRLLDAMASRYPNLTEEEIRRNRWGNNVIYVFEEHPLYPSLEALYGKRKNAEPVPMNVTTSKGINGSLLPNPDCIPGSTFYCPLPGQGLPDIKSDRSLSAFYFFPKQLSPHRSVLLPGVRRQRPVLSESDKENARRGGRGRGRGGGGYGGPPDRNGRGQYGGVSSYGDYGSSGRSRGGNDWQRPQRGSYNQSSYPPQNTYQQASSYSSYQSYQAPPSYQQNNGYPSRSAGPANYNGYGSNNSYSGRGRGGPRGGASDYNGGGYEGGGGRGYGGNSRGGYADSRGGGYGGYGYGNSSSGGYGGPPQNGYGGYGGGPPRGGPPNAAPNRGRGRAGWY